MTDKLLKRLRSAVVLTAVVWVAALVFAPTANATEDQEPVTVCPTWKLRGATGPYPAVVFGPAPAGSEVVDADTVVLKKPTGEALVQPGVEFAAFDLDISGAAVITVDYELEGSTEGAPIHGAGAVRAFYFADQDANTVTGTVAGFAAADSDSGTLSIPVVGHIGTLGMVYDDSNHTTGTVTFSNLKIDDNPVSFLDEVCASPSPSASASAPASASPRPSTSSPAAAPLPVTGSPVGLLTATGAGLVILGGAVVLLMRHRRRFEA